VIKSIKHKGLKKFFNRGISAGVRTDHVSRLQTRLAVLDAATSLDDIQVHNWGLHQLSGDLEGQWSIRVNGNWRLFFEFEDGDVYLLDYDDYH
jgi:toxin HigB-1